jgi:hypothetical protein
MVPIANGMRILGLVGTLLGCQPSWTKSTRLVCSGVEARRLRAEAIRQAAIAQASQVDMYADKGGRVYCVFYNPTQTLNRAL